MLAELHAKMAGINEMLESEQEQQTGALSDMLAKRRAKKEKLTAVLNNLSDKKLQEDKHYSHKLIEL